MNISRTNSSSRGSPEEIRSAVLKVFRPSVCTFFVFADLGLITLAFQKRSRSAHGSLTQAIGKRLGTETGIPQTQPTTSALPVVFSPPERYQGLTRQNAATRFPFIHFWTAKQFSDWEKERASTSDVLEVDEKKPQRGNARAKQGENVAYKFVEEEDGKVVDGHVAEAIRRRLQTILNGMAVRLPKKWRQVGNIDREYIFNEVYKAYPYLLLCHDDWKAERIPSAALSSFRSTTNKRHKREAARAEMTAVKSEEEVKYEAGSTLDANAATKRKASPETETVVAMKRPRLSISTSTTPSDPPSNDIESVKALSGEPRKGPQTEPPAEQPGMDILATVTSPNDRATSISSAQPSHRSDNEQPMDLLATCNGQNEKAALASVSRAEPPQDVQSSPPHSGAEQPNVDLHATAGKAKGPGIVNPLYVYYPSLNLSYSVAGRSTLEYHQLRTTDWKPFARPKLRLPLRRAQRMVRRANSLNRKC